MHEPDIKAIRKDYVMHTLDESEIDASPISQFMTWFEEAIKSEVLEVNAMNLATVDSIGRPHSRIVLLKGVEKGTFKFYTNYESDKGREIAGNNNVSICFFWKELERQVRIEGVAEKLSKNESETYFKSRPHLSQIGAHTSNQSELVKNREQLEDKFQDILSKYEEGDVPLPENWGGYQIQPTYFEFWQGRQSRLHDRIAYQKQDDNSWKIFRLSP